MCHAIFRCLFAELASTQLMSPAPLIIVSTGPARKGIQGFRVKAFASQEHCKGSDSMLQPLGWNPKSVAIRP